MKLITATSNPVKLKIIRALQVSGLAVVMAVNLFVFGSDFLAKYFNTFPEFQKIFLHASEEHAMNKAPFALPLHFEMKPAPLMASSSDIPAVVFQTMPAIIFLLILFLTLVSLYTVLRLGEDLRSSVFDPSLISPPPKRFL